MNLTICNFCGLAYDPDIGHFCSEDIRERIEKLEKVIESSTIGSLTLMVTELQGDVAQLEVCLEDERKENKQLREICKELFNNKKRFEDYLNKM